MTKTFCDRCKKEITNDIMIYHVHAFEDDGCERVEADICDDCHKEFESFMKMEDSMYNTRNIPNNHGIERTTIGSR